MAKKKFVKRLARKIQKRNLRFEAMNGPARRVEIAKEVLSLFDRKKLAPTNFCGGYIEFATPVECDNEELQTVFEEEKAPTCTVCAIGAMFMGAVCKFDKFKTKQLLISRSDKSKHIHTPDIDVSKGFFPYIRKFFSLSQLALIEVAYELSARGVINNKDLRNRKPITDEQVETARSFGSEFGSHELRLRAIMKNVIENKGTFRPTVKTTINA